MFVGTDRENL